MYFSIYKFLKHDEKVIFGLEFNLKLMKLIFSYILMFYQKINK